MPLTAGARLGPYEIVSALGAGGMGEVYKARDTTLNRFVAIKILPESFAHDPERLERFQREAITLASLNHPNIAIVHGFEEAGGIQALVMELVEGPTLADTIARGPMPLDESLAIARQIAEALEAAHGHGIIHRDLKPANIKVRPDGTVKVLDFGLAKAFSGDGSGVAATPLSHSPTITSPVGMTAVGVILGTAAYMAPEQARGKAIDKRADIWAFGCVLYEMLSGRQAFEGDEVTDVLARVIEREPDFGALPPNTPAALRRLTRRCLEKDRKRRLADIADARLEMDEAEHAPQTDAPPTQKVTQPWERLAWIGAVLIGAVVSVLAARSFQAADDAPEMRMEIVTAATSDPMSFAISPDGRHLVFVASGDGPSRLWLRPLDNTTARPLLGTEGARHPFWSPDSRSVGFFGPPGGTLKRIDIEGGLPQLLANASVSRGGTWGPDGAILFVPTSNAGQLSRVPASGGEAVALSLDSVSGQIRFPQFLSDGRRFLFYVTGTADAQGIYLGSLDSSETKRLTAADSAGAYAPPGWLLFVRQGALVARHFDFASGDLSGDPVKMADPVGYDVLNAGAFSVSASGLIAYRASGGSRRQLTWFDRSGKALGTFGLPDETPSSVTLSRDGLRAAVHGIAQNNTDVFVFDAARRTRFTFDVSNDSYPIWSPGGERIVFDSNRNGGIRNLYQKLSNGGVGSEELLLASPFPKAAADWSRDGQFLLYSRLDPKNFWDLWVLPFEKDGKPGKPAVFSSTGFGECCGQFSPNGRWVAYQSNESGQWDINVRAFRGPDGQWPVSTSGGIQPRWARDGKELYYIAPDGALMAVPITLKGEAIEAGSPARLFRTRIWSSGPTARQQYDVTADGRFLINVTTGEDTIAPITLLLNWKPPNGKSK